MTERKPFQFKKIKQNEYEPVHLPPSWCGSICRNAMNEVCVESCAIKRDCSAFEPKANLDLSNMPHFPLEESATMTKEEKFTSVTIYLAKVVDHLQGVENESRLFKRHRIHNTGIGQILENIQSQTILLSAAEEIASPETGPEHSGKNERSSEVARSTD